jgi:hypothetical protein
MKALSTRVAILALVVMAAGCAAAQDVPSGPVREISAPTRPLPEEDASAGITRFSFIAYGDTRGRQDGIGLQYEHSRVLDSMIGTIARLEGSAYPVRFVLQSGDAVVNGRDATHWNRSFVDLVNRMTSGAGVPYFLAAGNHDVTSAADLGSPAARPDCRTISQRWPGSFRPRARRADSMVTRPTPSATATRSCWPSTRTSPATKPSSNGSVRSSRAWTGSGTGT